MRGWRVGRVESLPALWWRWYATDRVTPQCPELLDLLLSQPMCPSGLGHMFSSIAAKFCDKIYREGMASGRKCSKHFRLSKNVANTFPANIAGKYSSWNNKMFLVVFPFWAALGRNVAKMFLPGNNPPRPPSRSPRRLASTAVQLSPQPPHRPQPHQPQRGYR